MWIKTTLLLGVVLAALAPGILAAAVAVFGEEIRLRAELFGPFSARTLNGRVDFSQYPNLDRRQFSVEVEGFTEGHVLDVTVAGVSVGKIEVDGFGIGLMEFDDMAEDPGDLDAPFPATFPTIGGGERVSVGSALSGTLEPR